jgi:hypothetical protein
VTPHPAVLAIASILLMAAGVAAWRYLVMCRIADTASRMAPALLEHDEFFGLVDMAGRDSHFLERHGPMLRIGEVLQRAESGVLEVSGLVGRPVASTRWLRHSDLRSALVSAIEHWESGARPAGGRFAFEFDRDIGEGFLKEGGDLIKTRIAIVIIRDGEIVTAFPSISEPGIATEWLPHRVQGAGASEQ